jgi:hypothetical protein
MKGKAKLILIDKPTWLMALLFLVVFSAFPANSQEPALSRREVSDALTRQGYSSNEKEAFETMYQTLERKNLPLEPLFRRWQQGAAKGVSPGQLLAVLEEESKWIMEAGEILDLRGTRLGLDRRSEYYLNRFLSLRRKGISRDNLQELVDAAPDGISLDRGSLLLLELDQWGMRGPSALRLTTALIRGPLSPDDFGYIIPLLQRGLSAGLTADILVDEIILYLPRSRDLLDLQDYLGF